MNNRLLIEKYVREVFLSELHVDKRKQQLLNAPPPNKIFTLKNVLSAAVGKAMADKASGKFDEKCGYELTKTGCMYFRTWEDHYKYKVGKAPPEEHKEDVSNMIKEFEKDSNSGSSMEQFKLAKRLYDININFAETGRWEMYPYPQSSGSGGSGGSGG